jgi:hypothetical protein
MESGPGEEQQDLKPCALLVGASVSGAYAQGAGVRVGLVQGAPEPGPGLVVQLAAQVDRRAVQRAWAALGPPLQAERIQARRQAVRAIQPVVPRRERFVAAEVTIRQAGKRKLSARGTSVPRPYAA